MRQSTGRNGSRTFVKITNNDIYNSIEELKQKIESLHTNVTSHISESDSEIKGIKGSLKWIYGIISSMVIAIVIKMIA